ncbi:hypothetical protein BpHYR1_000193 [Brachionus plicatilis]|uniref:Uncharacterized protein n=1 Tax=Brachionus plicatilis TaxID=10195 RepID=A0A3M7P515_BRAPC|nr:hypothetical protein BpHYR1_000193 [Brachionus plicatilis]
MQDEMTRKINSNLTLIKHSVSDFVLNQKATIALSQSLNETPIKPKQVPTQIYSDPGKQKHCDRLYIWGYAGVGALVSFSMV